MDKIICAKYRFISILGISAVFAIAPLLVLAQAPADLKGVADIFLKIFQVFVPVIIGLAVLIFLWGIAKFVLNAGNEQAREEGKRLMIWGIVALFVMVSVWGLVQILIATFGVTPAVPFFPAP